MLGLGAVQLTGWAATDQPAAAEGPAPVQSVGVQLPVKGFSGIELDEDRGRLYLAEGAGAGLPLVVTDLNGKLLTQVNAVRDVSDVVLTDDGGTLLGVQGWDRIVAVDAESLTPTATYAAPDGACVDTVAPTGDKIVAGFQDCGIGTGGLLLWSTPDTSPVVYTEGPDYHPVIDSSPGAPGLLVAGDTGYSPVSTYVIDVSGATPRIVSKRDYTGNTLQDYAFSPDGTTVVESVRAPYRHNSYTVPELGDSTVYPSGAFPEDAAWSADSSTVAIQHGPTGSYDADIALFDKSATVPKYALDFRSGDEFWPGTLLVNRDGSRAWAVSYNDVYGDTQLLHSFGPGHAPRPPVTDLAVSGSTGTGKGKQTASLTVTWSSPMTGNLANGVNDYYWWITASTDGGAEREFWRGRMDSSGEYGVTYALPKGTTTFTVRFKDFEDWYPPGYDTVTLTR